MIISVETAKQLVTFNGWTDEKIKMKLLAVEQTIRAYTNNNFQNRGIRVKASIQNGMLTAKNALIPFAVDDTIQVSESLYNNGLYTVSGAYDDSCTINEDIRDEAVVTVTKVEYPADVVACCVELMEWAVNYGGKVGVKSETLSRHSVTYEDSATLFMGYPVGILNGLKLHRKARF